MENIEQFEALIFNNKDLANIIKLHEPLAPKSTFKVGGTARIFMSPTTISQLQTILYLLKMNPVKYFILGGGSNIVFPDNEYNGVIISTENLNSIQISTSTQGLPSNYKNPYNSPNLVFVTCQSGTPTTALVNFCTKNNLSGAEQFAGLPGSIGGNLYMNARCFDKSISDILVSTQHFTTSQPDKIITSDFDLTQWEYKKSPFQSSKNNKGPAKIITAATFVFEQKTPQDAIQIQSDCKKYIAERVNKGHFSFPSAGSVFKNNHTFGSPSGKLIDMAGLKGYTIGGAQIAPFHGNFIINTNHATQKDIFELVKFTQQSIKQKFGFILEPEIIFVDK